MEESRPDQSALPQNIHTAVCDRRIFSRVGDGNVFFSSSSFYLTPLVAKLIITNEWVSIASLYFFLSFSTFFFKTWSTFVIRRTASSIQQMAIVNAFQLSGRPVWNKKRKWYNRLFLFFSYRLLVLKTTVGKYALHINLNDVGRVEN